VGYLRFTHKKCKPAKEQIYPAGVQHFVHPSNSLKPNGIYNAGIIFKAGLQPACTAFSYYLCRKQRSTYVRKIIFTREVTNFVYPCTIDMPEGEMEKQITKCMDVKLLAKQIATLRCNAC